MLQDQIDYAEYVTKNAIEGHRADIEEVRTYYNFWVTLWLAGQIVTGLYLNSLVAADDDDADDFY